MTNVDILNKDLKGKTKKARIAAGLLTTKLCLCKVIYSLLSHPFLTNFYLTYLLSFFLSFFGLFLSLFLFLNYFLVYCFFLLFLIIQLLYMSLFCHLITHALFFRAFLLYPFKSFSLSFLSTSAFLYNYLLLFFPLLWYLPSFLLSVS
jgi:hypothetical protein